MADAVGIRTGPLLFLMLRGGLLALMVPLSFDAILSLLTQNLGSYSPPIFYPVLFLLGAVSAYSGQRSKESERAND